MHVPIEDHGLIGDLNTARPFGLRPVESDQIDGFIARSDSGIYAEARSTSVLHLFFERPAAGIWESRGARKQFVYSRLQCWVAFDRAARMSVRESLPGEYSRWMSTRDRLYDQIMSSRWNPNRQAFRQDYDSSNLDASTLLMPMMKFISPTDPRMASTLDAILASLTMDNLVYRYDPDKPIDSLSGPCWVMRTTWACIPKRSDYMGRRWAISRRHSPTLG
jgi:GH15 family glucan-1,4-alpha-glucosidase